MSLQLKVEDQKSSKLRVPNTRSGQAVSGQASQKSFEPSSHEQSVRPHQSPRQYPPHPHQEQQLQKRQLNPPSENEAYQQRHSQQDEFSRQPNEQRPAMQPYVSSHGPPLAIGNKDDGTLRQHGR